MAVPLVVTTMIAMAELVRSKNEGNNAAMQAQLEKMRIEANNRALEVKGELMSKIIDLEQHIYDSKLDTIKSAFETQMDLITDYQKTLTDELKELTNQERVLYNDIDARALVRGQISEIKQEIMALQDGFERMRRDYNQEIMMLGINITLNENSNLLLEN